VKSSDSRRAHGGLCGVAQPSGIGCGTDWREHILHRLKENKFYIGLKRTCSA